MFTQASRRRRRKGSSTQASYTKLESRKLLTLAAPPATTDDINAFADSVEDAIVRIDDMDRLIIRTTGESNQITINLDLSYIQVNNESFSSLALEVQPERYDSILLLSGGDDTVRVLGQNLRAQMHPTRLWVATDNVGNQVEDGLPLQIFGSSFENVQVHDALLVDFGHFIVRSNNQIRMYGSEGTDYLNMETTTGLVTRTTATLVGEGYRLSSNAFGDLYVTGSGGEDFGMITGTRGYRQDALAVFGSPTDGKDLYFARDNFAQLTNELFNARFVDIETQRVDLLSGDDRAVIMDENRVNAYYRVDGEHLVGAFRRLINTETIQVDAIATSQDFFFRPDPERGAFFETETELRYEFKVPSDESANTEPGIGPLPPLSPAYEIIPGQFSWRFLGIENVLD
jgi:hypothetical protein